MRALAILLFCFCLCGAGRAQEPAKGWLGAELADVTKQEAEALGWEGPRGAKLVKPVPGGPAEKAGLLSGDILLSAGGVEAETVAGFIALVSGKAPGAEIKLRLLRGGKEKRLAVTLGTRPVEQPRAEPKDVPILQLDTGGHMAIIKGLAFTPDGKFIVSASHDKVIRAWDWRTGKTVRTLRGQSGPGFEGKIYAMALSPDGRWLAVGGCMKIPGEEGHHIRLYDFKSGELKVLLKGHSDVVSGLAFSPDSKKLISGSLDHNAILWDTGSVSSASVEARAPLHRLQGHREEIYAVGFTPDGRRAVTGSEDKTLRLWSVADGALLKEKHGDKIYALAISPKDSSVASGYESGEIRLWDGKSGAPKKVLVPPGGNIGSLRFSPDGRLLLSTCGGDSCNFTQRIYDTDSGKELTAYARHNDIVLASAFSPDGSLVATGGGDQLPIHVWYPKTGETKAVLKGTGTRALSVGFSAVERSIAWGTRAYPTGEYINDRGPLEMALRLPGADAALAEPEPVKSQEGWVRAKASSGALSLQHRKGGAYGYDAILDFLKDGKPSEISIERGSADGYDHRSYTFSPDGYRVISGGGGGKLTAFGLDGKELYNGDFVGHEGDVWAVAASPDGRHLLSGSGDQTVRLWNIKTRELLVTIFRGTDGEWVMWTPQGYYTGSPGADKIVGWQINRGADKAADYVTAEQLRKHLNRPDIVAKAIQLASAEEAVRTSYGTEFKLSDLLARPAPRLRILSPEADATVNAPESVAVKIALDATPDPVTRIRIQVNGRQLDDFLPQNGPKFEAGDHEFKVPLAKGKNTIVVTALNEIGWSKVQDGTLSLTNESAGSLDKRGTLYILAIGVSKYPGVPHMCKPKPSCDLEFTGNDAIAFADSMEAKLGALHEKVVRRVLVNEGKSDGAPTAANIVDALGLLGEAQANDTVAVFLAGHGANEGPNYRFIPTDAAVANGTVRPSSVVPWYAIEEAIDGAKGRRLLFIDTCHAAGAYNERLGNAAYYANILAYSSARWDQVAWESPKLGHGFFTEAIVEGLAGKADASGGGRVNTAQLNAYVQARVRELAKAIGKEQDPQFFKGRDAEDYTLAVLH
ncbi:MAG: PDZ domain-containing protein [Rhodomicrobium sp.]